MAAVPQVTHLFTDPSAPTWPVSPGPSRPAATVLRFPRPRGPTLVAADPNEGHPLVGTANPVREITAAWALVLGLAILGFVLF
ncbi:MAG: hypothetical protein JWO51_3687 [Rhodospirillales bacterium]|nr:hypothetical protein [Rhodospirillales bacterium]